MSGDDTPSIRRIRVPRKLVGARRLLIASIGAATVNYAGCGDDTMTLVANLMAAPFMPPQGDGGAGRSAPNANPDGVAGAPAISPVPDTEDMDGGTDEGNLGDRT